MEASVDPPSRGPECTPINSDYWLKKSNLGSMCRERLRRDAGWRNENFCDRSGLVTKHLKKGDRIRIAGLGIAGSQGMGRNPTTGEPIKIAASKKVAFRAAKNLKEAV
jgi:hypothetical protein